VHGPSLGSIKQDGEDERAVNPELGKQAALLLPSDPVELTHDIIGCAQMSVHFCGELCV